MNILKQGLNTLSHSLPQTCLQIPIWKGIKGKTTYGSSDSLWLLNYCITKTWNEKITFKNI